MKKIMLMDIQNLPLIEVYLEGRKWKWKIMHKHTGVVIGTSLIKFDTEKECLKDLKTIGRLISAWATAQEASIEK